MSKLTVRAGTLEEEYNEACRVLKKMSWYKKQGYTVSLPDEPYWKDLANKSAALDSDNLDSPEAKAIFDQIDSEEMRQRFQQSEYQPSYFDPGLQAIEENRDLIERAIAKLPALKKRLGEFEILPEYEVVLTKYGPGGKYELTGQISMMTRADGTFKRDMPYMTPVHEIVHIGIENGIVKKHGLTHWEKERLVDTICATHFTEELQGYKMQNIAGKEDAQNIAAYLSKKGGIDNLRDTIQQYTQEYPRGRFTELFSTKSENGKSSSNRLV